jgi:hypothetical protein
MRLLRQESDFPAAGCSLEEIGAPALAAYGVCCVEREWKIRAVHWKFAGEWFGESL